MKWINVGDAENTLVIYIYESTFSPMHEPREISRCKLQGKLYFPWQYVA